MICGVSSYGEELPEPFHVQLAECRQKLFNQVAAQAHAGQLLSPQIFNIFHSGLEVDCALQSTRLSKNVLGLPLAIAIGLATFVSVAVLRLPLIWVLVGIGGLSCVISYRRLA